MISCKGSISSRYSIHNKIISESDLGPMYLVLVYIFEVLVLIEIMGHVLVLVHSDFMSTSEHFLKYDAVIISYDFILNTE